MLLAALRICARVFARFCFHVRVFAATPEIHSQTHLRQAYICTSANIHSHLAKHTFTLRQHTFTVTDTHVPLRKD